MCHSPRKLYNLLLHDLLLSVQWISLFEDVFVIFYPLHKSWKSLYKSFTLITCEGRTVIIRIISTISHHKVMKDANEYKTRRPNGLRHIEFAFERGTSCPSIQFLNQLPWTVSQIATKWLAYLLSVSMRLSVFTRHNVWDLCSKSQIYTDTCVDIPRTIIRYLYFN